MYMLVHILVFSFLFVASKGRIDRLLNKDKAGVFLYFFFFLKQFTNILFFFFIYIYKRLIYYSCSLKCLTDATQTTVVGDLCSLF